MKYLKLIILLLATVLLIASCKKDENELPVEFKFRLLDTLGNEKTVFNLGENIIFSFLVINNSSEDIYLKNFLPNDDFFRISQTNSSEGILDYGVPYGVLYFIGGTQIEKNDNIDIRFAWKKTELVSNSSYFIFGNTDTYNLPIGDFYTGFSQSFELGNEIQTEEKHFEINFTVK